MTDIKKAPSLRQQARSKAHVGAATHLVPIITHAPRRRKRLRYRSTILGDIVIMVMAAAIGAPIVALLIRAACWLLIQLVEVIG